MQKNFGRRWALAVLAAGVLAVPLAAGAFLTVDRPGVPAQLRRDQIFQGDYIAVGEVVELAGNVDGDVIVAAQRLVVSGAVSGDVIAAASSVEISGDVEGDVRVAAMQVDISGIIGRNANLWGQQVTMTDTASVGRNLYAVGEQLTLQGTVGRNLAVRALNVAIRGSIGGAAQVHVGDRGTIALQSGTDIKSSFTYEATAATQLTRDESAKVGGEVRHLPWAEPESGSGWPHFLFFRIIGLFGMFVVGLVLVTFAPKAMVGITQQSWTRQPLPAFAWGLVITVATPAAALVLAFTIIGLPLALLSLGAYLMALYLAQVVAGIALGIFAFSRLPANRSRGSLVLPMVLGMTLLFFLTAFLGPLGILVKIFAVLWGVGALWRFKTQQLAQWR
ncbi:MAG: hypothetical protein Q7S23_00970 [bacterium]|nr:hypothetical protein [bacterium]